MLVADMRLIAGSAAIDLTGAGDTTGIVVDVRDVRVSFAKSGLYRVDAPVGGDVAVRSIGGRAWVEWRDERLKVAGGRELTIAASARKLKAGKFEKSEQDALDGWNREREQFLAAKSRENQRGRDNGPGPLENSEIYRCRVMGRGCPVYNLNTSQASRPWNLRLPLSSFQVGAR
jgi:hypothetical protein